MERNIYTMLKATFVCALLFSISSLGFGQTVISKSYYKDEYKRKAVKSETKAKFVETKTKLEDATVTHEFRQTNGNKLLYYRAFKDDKAVGIWKEYNVNTNKTQVTDFNTLYSNKEYSGVYYDFVSKTLEESNDQNFVAPSIKGHQNSLACVYTNIQYPAICRENGTMGTTNVLVKIDKTGHLEVLRMHKALDPYLDAESAKTLAICNKWNPATLDGTPIDVYTVIPIKFRLE